MDRTNVNQSVSEQRSSGAQVVSALLREVLTSARLGLRFSVSTTEGSDPWLTVVFTGDDVPHLLARNAELLLALEHVAAKALRLEPEQHDQISFDAGGFKQQRERSLERAAQAAIREVLANGRAFHFPPMNSRERRLLHLLLTNSGLRTASEGDGAARHLVLHPTG